MCGTLLVATICWVVVATLSTAARVSLCAPHPYSGARPQLVLISGATGAGKSTLGMSVAVDRGILRCVSTDSIREIVRIHSTDAAVHRSSYSGAGDPVEQWRECCSVLESSVKALAKDAVQRGISLVMEGVHIVPSPALIDLWTCGGGSAVGCVLTVKDTDAHRQLISTRGAVAKSGAESQLKAFARIRAIQDEMIRLAAQHRWLVLEQRLEPDPQQCIAQVLSALGSHS